MYTTTLEIPGQSLHQVVGVNIGTQFADIYDWRFINPSSDSTLTLSKLKDAGVTGIVINYTLLTDDKTGLIDVPMFKFVPDGSGGWMDSGYRNSNFKLKEERGKYLLSL
jgi:hypothetical protein